MLGPPSILHTKDTVNRLSRNTAASVLEETLPREGKPLQVLTQGDGIRWLHAAVSNYDHYDWRDDSLEESLVEVLRLCWIKKVHEVQHEPEVRQAFQSLLGLLIQRQNAAAFELRDEVNRSIGT